MNKQIIVWVSEECHRLLKVKAAKEDTTITALAKYALDIAYFRNENGELGLKPDPLIERHPAPKKCDWCDGWCAVPCSKEPAQRRGPFSQCQGRCECVHGDPECKAAAEGRRIRALA